MDLLSDKKIIDSWKKNIAPWVVAIQEKKIESRKQVTDQAIVQSVMGIPANTVLDVGCGEGWLARELSKGGLSVTGIDAVEGLVSSAKELGGGLFHVLSYEQLSPKTIPEKHDIAVCNFSLLGKESVEHLIKIMPSLLNEEGRIIIQTLHPKMNCGDLPYADGWREGSWAGLSREVSDDFCDPAPWYFRTQESWVNLLHSNGFDIENIKEPINPNTGKPASLILVGKVPV